MHIQESISLSKYTTYKVGGPARYFAEPSQSDEILELFRWARSQSLKIFLLGKGSNLVVSDQGFDGLVIYLGRTFKSVQFLGNQVQCQAGALLHQVVVQSVKQGLAGIQHLAGIPGTMGGGAYINAGAFSQELGQVIDKVESIEIETGITRIRNNKECGFGYRHSIFFDKKELITQVWLDLQAVDAQALELEMNDTLRKRKSKQPLEYPNAGSMYKRPVGTFAGKLIEDAGLKGFQIGGAQISPHHANFVINVGDCTAQDIYDLSEEVTHKVAINSGIVMEKEQIFLGSFLSYPRS